jgi:glycosyltransferase involved in cell wall biosynthesis
MAEPRPSLSVIVLMFNEAACIADTLDETLEFLADAVDDWELLVIDDGSTDSSPAIVESYAAREPRIRLLRHGANKGMGAGMETGVRHATRDYLVFVPADGQIAAREIGVLLDRLGDGEIVLSTYAGGRNSVGRALLSRGLRAYLRKVASIDFALEGLYLFPTAAAQEIAPRIRARTFFFSFELIQRGIERGLTTTTTDIRCRPRQGGTSKIANLRKIRQVADEALRYGIARRTTCGRRQ